jgi:2-polyprenyl-6-hydroxyphenyl methylase/3-demethylubiquinone-9 3-methyltransferase
MDIHRRRAVSTVLQAICAPQTPCKCCGVGALLYGVVDFHKNCESHRRKVLDLSGVPIYYHRCPACQFLFTTAFDQFTTADFLQYIYNDGYLAVDPEYPEVRPRALAEFLSALFRYPMPRRILDYGGGDGALAALLESAGLLSVTTYDPFVARFSAKPRGRFDCVLCFEVIEHSPEPDRIFSELNDFLSESGLIILSTLLQPADLDQHGLNWWYAGPRNGHVSLYSRTSLEYMAGRFGFTVGSFSESMHVLFRQIPDFARHWIRGDNRESPMCSGSRQTETSMISG